MGYRSDVTVCMKKENFEEIKEIEAKNSENLMDYIEDYRERDNVVVFSWNCIKWYQEFNEIEIFENYLDNLDEKDVPYKFIRIGEDWDDTEVRENWSKGECDYIFVDRIVSSDI